jgi:hypothetical protein
MVYDCWYRRQRTRRWWWVRVSNQATTPSALSSLVDKAQRWTASLRLWWRRLAPRCGERRTTHCQLDRPCEPPGFVPQAPQVSSGPTSLVSDGVRLHRSSVYVRLTASCYCINGKPFRYRRSVTTGVQLRNLKKGKPPWRRAQPNPLTLLSKNLADYHIPLAA